MESEGGVGRRPPFAYRDCGYILAAPSWSDGRKNVAPSHALLLRPCSSVHMCFMRFSIDVAFVKRQEDGEGWQVVKVARGLRPWTGLGVCTEADAVLEMGMGEAERIGMEPGTVWEEVRMEAEKYVNTSPPL